MTYSYSLGITVRIENKFKLNLPRSPREKSIPEQNSSLFGLCVWKPFKASLKITVRVIRIKSLASSITHVKYGIPGLKKTPLPDLRFDRV